MHTQKSPKAREVVLIVEDSAPTRRILKYILDKEGYTVLEADSGKVALGIIADQRIDLVLLDIMMAEVNGFEVCQRIAEGENMKDVPIIFCTALDDKECVLKAIQLGARDYIVKPFTRSVVLAKVTKALESRKDL